MMFSRCFEAPLATEAHAFADAIPTASPPAVWTRKLRRFNPWLMSGSYWDPLARLLDDEVIRAVAIQVGNADPLRPVRALELDGRVVRPAAGIGFQQRLL